MVPPEIVRRFEVLDLSPAEFNHAAHLEVASFYVVTFGAQAALDKMRIGLTRLLTHFGKSTGYKEDVTRFWIGEIERVIALDPQMDFDMVLKQMHARLGDAKLFALQSFEEKNLMDPRYPIGKFEWNGSLSTEQRKQALEEIAALPAEMRKAVSPLADAQLDTPYREGGWTIRQVVHHVADSHINSYVRFRLSLTEDAPAIKGYDEARWAELKDAKSLPVNVSLDLLDALHARWIVLLRSFSEAEWQRTFIHSELGPVTLERALGLYAWHGKHHVAHIRRTKFSTPQSA